MTRRTGASASRRSREAPPVDGATGPEPDADPYAVVHALCLRWLTARPRSRRELEQSLARRDADPEVVTRVLDRLTEVGLVDDVEYARMLTGSRVRERGLARRAVAAELRRRGVDDETAAFALATIDPDAEAGRAVELARRRQRSLAALAPDVQARRLVAFLARRGYASGVAYRAVRQVVGQVDDDFGPDASETD